MRFCKLGRDRGEPAKVVTTVVPAKIGATQYEYRRARRFVPRFKAIEVLDELKIDLLEGSVSLWPWSNGFPERVGMKRFTLLNQLLRGGIVPVNPKSSFNAVDPVLPFLSPQSC